MVGLAVDVIEIHLRVGLDPQLQRRPVGCVSAPHITLLLILTPLRRYCSAERADCPWGLVREAQEGVTYSVGACGLLHPVQCQCVSRRRCSKPCMHCVSTEDWGKYFVVTLFGSAASDPLVDTHHRIRGHISAVPIHHPPAHATNESILAPMAPELPIPGLMPLLASTLGEHSHRASTSEIDQVLVSQGFLSVVLRDTCDGTRQAVAVRMEDSSSPRAVSAFRLELQPWTEGGVPAPGGEGGLCWGATSPPLCFMAPNYEYMCYETDTVTFDVSTPGVPYRTVRFHLGSEEGSGELIYEHTPEGFDAQDLCVFTAWVDVPPSPAPYEENVQQLGTKDRCVASRESESKVRVPISVVYRPDRIRQDGAPIMLKVYGCYGLPDEPAFDTSLLPLIDRGVVVGVAHVRGGGTLGTGWHDAGRRGSKRNAITDTVACARHVVQRVGCSRVGLWGQSAGGLVVAAAANMAPSAVDLVVLGSPFLDLLSAMLEPTLPQVQAEYAEWGNPSDPDDHRDYFYLRSYSPYDNLPASLAQYPHLLLTAGLHDPRCSVWEGAKFVARLRLRAHALPEWQSEVLLRVRSDAGHFLPSLLSRQHEEMAFELAFMLKHMHPKECGADVDDGESWQR